MKVLSLNVCNGTAKSAVTGPGDNAGSTGTTTLRGQFPINIWIFVDFLKRKESSGVVVLKCIVSRSV